MDYVMSINYKVFHIAMLMIVFAFITHFSAENCISQEIEGIEESLEIISQDSEEAEILDIIELLRANPINLFDASVSDIAEIPTFSRLTAKQIKRLIKEYPYIQISQIADSLELTPHQEILLDNCSYIEVINRKPQKNLFLRSRNMSYIYPVRGVDENIFQGNPYDIYNRIQYRNADFSAGILTNKDMGEVSYTDFVSGFAQYRNKQVQFIAGDYSLQLGLGSLFWRTFGVRKGAETVSPVSQFGAGIKEYASSMEINYFRGAAASYDFDFMKISTWYSDLSRAGEIDSVSNEIISVYSTGLFRTKNEILKKSNFNERIIGADLQFNFDNLILGLNAAQFEYSLPVNSSSSRYFAGKSGIPASVYFLFSNDNLLLSSELAKDAKANYSVKSNFEINFDDVDFAISYRYFPYEFRSPYSYNFGESSNASNEEGLYFGMKYNGFDKANFSIYADYYRSISSTYLLPMPLAGMDLFNENIIKLSKQNTYTLRLRYENKTNNFKDESQQQELLYQKRRYSIRNEIRHKYSSKLYFRVRFEIANVSLENGRSESGYAGFFEFAWQVNKWLNTGSRIAYFSTESFDSAIWQFEYAMPGFMTTSALYGEGTRSYAFIKLSPLQNLDFIIRYTVTQKNATNTIGSSWNEIEGNKDGRIYFQLDFKY